MRRITIVGYAPLPVRIGAPSSAAGLRAWQFARALAEDGHRVTVLLVGGVPGPVETVSTPAGATFRVTGLEPSEVDDPRALRRRLDRLEAEALVGASTHPSFLLARAGHPAPLWIDLHGDPMSEGQALARATGDDAAVERSWWMLAWSLRRGDRFSAVSEAQRHAVLGQLGASGRLNRATAGLELVHRLPDACELPGEAPPPAAGGGFEVIFTGSFNSWIDGDGFATALERALPAEPRLRFTICGGEVAGLADAPWRRFRDRLDRLPAELAARVALPGWVDGDELERVESAAGCGVVPELRLAERELGSQNRSLRWMARARPVVTTGQSELGRAIERLNLGLTYPAGDARALADALLRLARDPGLAARLGDNARRWVAAERSVAVTSAPLRAWAADPRPSPDRVDGSAPRLARRHPEMLRDQLHLLERDAGEVAT
jgi:glycosyltransferase involved in cell wall biosynthesis